MLLKRGRAVCSAVCLGGGDLYMVLTIIIILLLLFLIGYPRYSGSPYTHAEWIMWLVLIILILQLLRVF